MMDYLQRAVENLVVVTERPSAQPAVLVEMKMWRFGAAVASERTGLILAGDGTGDPVQVPEKFKEMNLKALKMGS